MAARDTERDSLVPPLYDVDNARRELAKIRRRRDELTRQQASIGDRLATQMDRHFSAEELETAGRALVIAAGSVGVLAQEGIPASVVVNIIAFAGDRLITDGEVT